MPYNEAEGVTFENVLTPLDEGARWVQWAEAGAGAGSNGTGWSGRLSDFNWNLGQFWKLKAEHYNEDPAAWDSLDLRAHKAWAAMSELGMVADNPPAQQKYRDTAKQAYDGALAIASRLGKSTAALAANADESERFFEYAQRAGIDDTYRKALEDRVGSLVDSAEGLLGIPLWAWIVGGAAVLWMTRR